MGKFGWERARGCGAQAPPVSLPSREEKAELLLDSQEEVQGLEAEIRRLRQEVRCDVPALAALRTGLSPRTSRAHYRAPGPFLASLDPQAPAGLGGPYPALHRLAQTQALSGQAKRAQLYREEAEVLRERAGRLPRLQDELRRCRERLQAAEGCKGQLEVRGRGTGAGPQQPRRGLEGAWSSGAEAGP